VCVCVVCVWCGGVGVCVCGCVCVVCVRVCVCVCDSLQPCSDREVPGGKDEKDGIGRAGKKTKEEREWRTD